MLFWIENRYCCGLKILSGTVSFWHDMKWAWKTFCVAIIDSLVLKKDILTANAQCALVWTGIITGCVWKKKLVKLLKVFLNVDEMTTLQSQHFLEFECFKILQVAFFSLSEPVVLKFLAPSSVDFLSRTASWNEKSFLCHNYRFNSLKKKVSTINTKSALVPALIITDCI